MPPRTAPRSYPGAVSEPVAAGYQPFPGFGEWAGVRLDLSTFDGYVSVLDELRARPDAAPLTRAVAVATRAAAIDTGAIEGLYEVDRGFTMTVARGVAAWEKVIAAREPVVRRSFEDALRAYDFVLDLATSRTEVSEMAVRQIHELICAGQETYRVVTFLGWQDRPLPKGRYKDDANNPVSRLTGEVHAYAPPLDVSAEMNRLVRELRSAEFVTAHPVLQAAWAHYAFVAVHPFADGNGRVARALASVFLYRRPGVPLVIFADQKDAYLDGLEAADAGHPERFVRFILERVADVVGLVQVSAQAPERSTETSLAAVREAITNVPSDQLDGLADRLRRSAVAALDQRLAALDLPIGVTRFTMDSGQGPPAPPQHYRVPVTDVSEVGLQAVGIEAAGLIAVGVRAIAGGPAFHLLSDKTDPLPVELREVFPVLTSVLQLKIGIWADNVVARLLADFEAKIR